MITEHFVRVYLLNKIRFRTDIVTTCTFHNMVIETNGLNFMSESLAAHLWRGSAIAKVLGLGLGLGYGTYDT